MNLEAIPIWVLFAATVGVVVIAIEAGYRLGRTAHRRAEDEKESPVSAIAASILGLLAFVLAFTFGIVSDRYEARKTLVRDEANAIRTAWLRSDFLPETDRGEAKGLLREYVDRRLAAVQSRDLDKLHKLIIESARIQRQLWDMAVVNARKDMNSDVAALYIESLNELNNLHASRVAVGLQARIPPGFWLVLYALVILGMIAVGYQTAIAGSRRSWVTLILALSFSLVIALIASLDRPLHGYVTVSQQPLADLRASMAAGFKDSSGRGEKP
jgi:hypothetical protein